LDPLPLAPDRDEDARHFWRTGTTVWRITYLVHAAALAVVIGTTTTGTALAVNRTAPWLISATLFAWMYRWGMRLRAEKPAGGRRGR